jgi:hypothetical protein
MAGAISNPSVRRSIAAISQSTSLALWVSAGSLVKPAREATQRLASPSVSGDELPAIAFMAASMKVTGFDPVEATARAR